MFAQRAKIRPKLSDFAKARTLHVFLEWNNEVLLKACIHQYFPLFL